MAGERPGTHAGLETAHRFIERAATLDNEASLGDAFLRFIEPFGFTSFIYVPYTGLKAVDQRDFVVSRYPEEWARRYHDESYYRVDAVPSMVRRRAMPFCWSDRELCASLENKQRRIFDEAAEFGLRKGVTIPIPTYAVLPASMHVAGDRPDDGIRILPVLHLAALYFHDSVFAMRRKNASDLLNCPHQPLTGKEASCLKLLANGYDDDEIAERSNESGGEVGRLIDSAMAKLGVKNRIHAVIRAILAGEIEP